MCVLQATTRAIDLIDTRPAMITARDIARGIATRFRYAGHTSELYTVAEHSIIVSFCVPPQHARRALLHDGAEGYLADIPSPLKLLPEMAGYRAIEDRLQRAIFARFDVPEDEAADAIVHLADIRIRTDEVAQIAPRPGAYDVDAMAPGYGHMLMCLEPRDAERAWLNRFREIFPRRMWA